MICSGTNTEILISHSYQFHLNIILWTPKFRKSPGKKVICLLSLVIWKKSNYIINVFLLKSTVESILQIIEQSKQGNKSRWKIGWPLKNTWNFILNFCLPMLIGRRNDISAKTQIISLPYKLVIPTIPIALTLGQSCHEGIRQISYKRKKREKTTEISAVLNLGSKDMWSILENPKAAVDACPAHTYILHTISGDIHINLHIISREL